MSTEQQEMDSARSALAAESRRVREDTNKLNAWNARTASRLRVSPAR